MKPPFPKWLHPYFPRSFHEWWARTFGYFWLPCPLCKEMTGGHEWLMVAVGPPCNTIPEPSNPHLSHGICPTCTRNLCPPGTVYHP